MNEHIDSPGPRIPLFRLLTNSETKTYKRCPREHHYAYQLGYRPRRPANALTFGTLLHGALEHWWRAAQRECPVATRLDVALGHLRSHSSDPFDLVRAEELLVGYHARWALEPWQVLAVEVEFDAPLVNPATGEVSETTRIGGTIDAIARNQDGLVYIVEHKTSGEDIELGSDYWKRLRIDSQISTYFKGAKALGFNIAGCLYDVIGKPKLQPSNATPIELRKYTKDGRVYANQHEENELTEDYRIRFRAHLTANIDRYLVRGIVTRLEDDERDAADDLWQFSETLSDGRRLNRFPRNDGSCIRYGRTCDFFSVCTREASLDDGTKFRQVSQIHEELGQKEAC